jgi:hypothetical protein
VLTDLTPVREAAGDGTGEAVPRRPSRVSWPPDRGDLVIGAVYLLGSVWVMYHLLRHPTVRVQRFNVSDDANFQWMLASGARVLSHGANPFFSRQMDVPDGVNLMANTSVLGLSIPLAPVTLLLGPAVAYAVLLVLALCGTATAWYHVLSRHLVASRTGASIGGLFCGFAPGMIAHANGHPNIVGQFLVPFLIWRSVRLREPGRAIRNGVALGLLVTWQAFINEEILLVTALGFGLFVGCYALVRRDALAGAVRPALRGLLVTAAVAALLLGYPLYVQFFGPQAYRGLGEDVRNFGADITSFTAFASQCLAGSGYTRGHFAQNASEENAFLGWPLVVLLAMLVWWLRRYAVVRALTVVALVFGLLSLGPRLYLHGRHTRIPAPFALLNHLPLFDTMVPTRLALAIIPVVGILLAFGYQKMSEIRAPDSPVPPRLLWHTLLVAALLPLVPRPLPTIDTLPTPAFVTSGTWRGYVPAGHSLVTVPLASSHNAQPMFWSAATGLDLPIARGYFLGPGPNYPRDRKAIFGAPKRPTSVLLDKVRTTGEVPAITQQDRTNAVTDLRYWRGSAVVLQPGTRHDRGLRKATTELLGFAPRMIGGVWVWDVRALVGRSGAAGRPG